MVSIQIKLNDGPPSSGKGPITCLLTIILSLSAPGMKDHLFQRLILDIIEKNENQSSLEKIIKF